MSFDPYSRSSEEFTMDLATHVLNYQPFIVSDDIQTGVAYSISFSTSTR